MSKIPVNYIGHDEIRANIARLIATSKLPGTVLFAGLPGVGKRTLARLLARALSTGTSTDNKDPFNDTTLRHGLDLTGIFEIDAANKEEVNAESIRELLSSFYRTSAQGKARVCIISHAENLPVISSNILLKTLEEPRANQYFILTSSNPSKILPTILSRCHRFSFSPLTQAEIERIIINEKWALTVSPAEAAFLADGSLKEIKNVGLLHEEWTRLSKIFDRLTSGDLSAGLLAISTLKEKEEIAAFLTLLRLYLRQRMITTLDSKWSTAIFNVLTAWRYIFDRNLSSSLILSNLITLLSHTGKKATLLEEYLEPTVVA
jgi:hypothetical protein